MKQSILSLSDFAAKAREAVAEGCVLLRNEAQALPLEKGLQIAVFGRAQMNYFKSGLGSGGMVNARYVKGVWEALQESGACELDAQVRSAYEAFVAEHPFDLGDGWAKEPWYQAEMPLDESLVSEAAARCAAAVVIIGRTAGEDKDNGCDEGSFLLTGEEEAMLSLVCRHFPRSIVLLNTGNIIDMTWVERHQPAAVMYIWQGGQDGGPGAVDVLMGHCSPSGRLTDTIAASVHDYPSDADFGDENTLVYSEDIYVGYRYFESFAKDKVIYPFGAGLSYTTFAHAPQHISWNGESLTLAHRVTNTGSAPSKEVVQVYARLPQGRLGKPERVLVGYEKTPVLAPGQSIDVTLSIPAARFASYDDSGVTGHAYCTLLEQGEYAVFSGHDVRCAKAAGSFILDSTLVLEQLAQACAPAQPFDRLHPENGSIAYESAPLRAQSPQEHRSAAIPQEIPQTGDRGLMLRDVQNQACTMDEFIAQLTDDDLCCIVRGEGMSSSRVTPGTAGAFGGVTDRLVSHFGIPTACCADGPSGIRMDCGNKAYAMPNGTCQACTWNDALIEELYVFEGLEMRKYQVDTLLGPGINIHRHPLNGRNFEYFSEDPLLTGRMTTAQLAGMARSGVTGTIKHFACNNQEKRRRFADAVVSERALREIYLKGFEIAVREGGARSIMTSYNPVNGCWTASHYDLVTHILRREWGYTGIVMTDWWAMGSEDGKEPSFNNVASMVRAQNDLFMVTNNPSINSNGDDSAESLARGTVARAEYQRCAKNICRFLLDTPAYRRSIGEMSEDDRLLQMQRDEDGDVILHIPEVQCGQETVIDGAMIDTAPGAATLLQMKPSCFGRYRVEMTCRAAAHLPDTAQVPVSVFIDSMLLGMHTLSGAQKDWITLNFNASDVRRRWIFYTKFFIAAGGLEIRDVRIICEETF